MSTSPRPSHPEDPTVPPAPAPAGETAVFAPAAAPREAETVGAGPPARDGDPAVPAVPGYAVLKELGRGGMGVVYQARHAKLNRVVALKMILGGGHAGPADLRRFVAEAEAVAHLQHPNVVQF